MAQRLLVTNRVQASATTLTASSSHESRPLVWLQDQLRSKTWRSDLGWTVVAGYNDKLDFSEGTTGDATATLDAGSYVSGDAYATEVQTQLNSAATDNTYTVTYSTSTHKYTIARDTGSATISLEWSTGANAATSCGRDLGFATAADDTGATSYVGDVAAYKSRQWVKADLGSALSVQGIAALDHNLGAAGTITVQGNATDAWSSPTVDEDLSGGDELRGKYLSAVQTLRYWRLVIDGVEVDASYAELGVWYLGPIVAPTVCDAIGRSFRPEQLSEVQVAISGAHFQDERAQRKLWGLAWRELEETDRSNLYTALWAVPRGTAFFFGWDSTDGSDMNYVWLSESWSQALSANLYNDISVPVLAEALG